MTLNEECGNEQRPETLTSVNSQSQGTLERRDLEGETQS